MKSEVIIEGRREHILVFFYFPINGLTNPEVFLPKTFWIPRRIIPQNFSSSGLVSFEELGNKQINSLTSYCFRRRIELLHIFIWTVKNIFFHPTLSSILYSFCSKFWSFKMKEDFWYWLIQKACQIMIYICSAESYLTQKRHVTSISSFFHSIGF